MELILLIVGVILAAGLWKIAAAIRASNQLLVAVAQGLAKKETEEVEHDADDGDSRWERREKEDREIKKLIDLARDPILEGANISYLYDRAHPEYLQEELRWRFRYPAAAVRLDELE